MPLLCLSTKCYRCSFAGLCSFQPNLLAVLGADAKRPRVPWSRGRFWCWGVLVEKFTTNDNPPKKTLAPPQSLKPPICYWCYKMQILWDFIMDSCWLTSSPSRFYSFQLVNICSSSLLSPNQMYRFNSAVTYMMSNKIANHVKCSWHNDIFICRTRYRLT